MAHKVTLRFTRIRQRVIQRHEESTLRHYCPSCQREVVTITTAEASRVLEIDLQTLLALVGDGNIHAIESESGSLCLCKESLFLE